MIPQFRWIWSPRFIIPSVFKYARAEIFNRNLEFLKIKSFWWFHEKAQPWANNFIIYVFRGTKLKKLFENSKIQIEIPVNTLECWFSVERLLPTIFKYDIGRTQFVRIFLAIYESLNFQWILNSDGILITGTSQSF